MSKQKMCSQNRVTYVMSPMNREGIELLAVYRQVVFGNQSGVFVLRALGVAT